MRQFIKNISEYIGMCLSFLWPRSISGLWQTALSHIYTGYIRRHFLYLGKDSVILYKATALKGLEYISIGTRTNMDKYVSLTAWDMYMGIPTKPEIKIGDNCQIGAYAHITSCNYIHIGNNLLTGTNVLITDNAHGISTREQLDIPPISRQLFSKGGITIGNNVWLGNNVCILPGVTIGDGVIIGSNSVVTKDIPPYSIAAGVPASIIRQL